MDTKPSISLELAIPEDIIPCILLKLPIKSLLRLKCVSKYFKTLISSPEFINFHLRTLKSSSDDEKLYILQSYDHSLYSLDSSSPSPVQRLELRYPGKSSVRYTLIGSCNGLHCIQWVHRSYLDYVIFNPSIGVYKEIGFYFLDNNGIFSVNSGFGFDDVNNDYKIVMLISTCVGVEPFSCQIFVYSLMTNSWRALNIHFNVMELTCLSAAVVDGHRLHFLFREGVIGCFDIKTEQWSKFVLPTSITHDNILYDLGVFDDLSSLGDERLQGERLMEENYNPLESRIVAAEKGFTSRYHFTS